ncbi:reverse transcriptase domain-containing protein [Tanacetum coccineum]
MTKQGNFTQRTPQAKKHATKVTNLKVAIHPDYPEQEVSIGGSLSDTGRAAVCALLQRNLDIFAWEPKHMTGVPRSITEHKLKIRQGYSPIDWKVESLCGYPFKCFLDAYKGYHQIQMAKDDEEKTAFHTSQGVYCYTKMPFGLKNAGATYQRLVDNAFEGQVGRNLEVYVDDLVIKSHTEDELVRDIVETFRALRKINMKLNPKKCTFGATEGMFLGYLIEPDGIKPCPEKTKAVPIQVSRQVTPLVQNTQEVYEEGRLPLDYSSRGSFHAAQAAYSSTSHASRTPTRGGVDYRNGEADPGVSICRQKTAQIFPSAPNSGNHRSTHTFGPDDEVSPPRHQKERRGKDNRRPPVFGRIGKKVLGTQTANLQNLDTHENNDWRISVRDRLGSRDVHSRLGERRSPSDSPPRDKDDLYDI